MMELKKLQLFLDWKLRSVDVLLLVLSEEKAIPGKKVLR